ncbi:unnamed protein product [Phaedon cochleariae]|uniref:C2H2-type domain-containing protein n=1 Tax=Phaedon cochleariae TaxID=80249 RepID=A0A9N9X0X5_PHACE|nr:unnamed protein product [Phaedon cochleariae]
MSNDWGISNSTRIPKRKADNLYEPNNAYCNVENPVLANSYYNNYYNQYDQTQTQWQQGMSYSQTQGTSSVEPIAQNIFKTLSTIQEKPKNLQRNIFKDTVPDVEDETLPKELTAMFQPLFCKLCSAQLSSNVMAKLHYKSRNHEKKIKKFLIDYSERTGEPLHKRAKIAATPKTEEELNPRWFHCDVCDLSLTGKQHAESHYMGRNHHKAVMGQKAPAGRGFFNAEGKWVRQAVPKKVILANGQDTFGMDFKKAAAGPAASAPDRSDAHAPQSQFFCDLCAASCTTKEQLEIHRNGNRHQKKLKQLGMAPKVPAAVATAKPGDATLINSNPTNTCPINSILASEKKAEYWLSANELKLNDNKTNRITFSSKAHHGDTVKLLGVNLDDSLNWSKHIRILCSKLSTSTTDNLSVYRTPSGGYYCPTCNLALNSESQFLLHVKSKAHMKKAASQKQDK